MHKYIVLFTKKKNNKKIKKISFCIQPKLMCILKQQMAAKAKVQLKLLDVFEDSNDFVDMSDSIYRRNR